MKRQMKKTEQKQNAAQKKCDSADYKLQVKNLENPVNVSWLEDKITDMWSMLTSFNLKKSRHVRR